MDKKTSEALEKSIKHWEENVAAGSCDDIRTEATGCALCDIFNEDGCVGCPVMDATGRDYCKETPYTLVTRAVYEGSITAAHKAAKAELEFLKGLRTC